MEAFIRRVNYHETDKMGITHHSNYIKFMEEARVDFLDKIGYGYSWLEAQGLISPVIGIECDYRAPTTFSDEIKIEVRIEEFKGVRLVIGYKMTNNKTGQLVLTGRSKHCFLNGEGKPVALRRSFPELDEALKAFLPKGEEK